MQRPRRQIRPRHRLNNFKEFRREVLARLITALVTARWMERCAPHRLIVHHWHDHADEAVRKFLGRNKLRFLTDLQNVETVSRQCLDKSPTVSVTPEPEPEPSQGQQHTSPPGFAADGELWADKDSPVGIENDAVDVAPKTVFDAWNAMPAPFPKCRELTKKRRAAIKTRWCDKSWRENWRDGLERMQRSRFCRGEVPGRNGQTPWKANLDWFLKPDP